MPRAGAALLLAALVSACSVAPQRELPDVDAGVLWSQRAERLNEIDSWVVNGRVALRGSEVPSRSVHMHWRQQDSHFEIALLSLLGRRVAELSGGPGRVTLRLPDEEPLTAADSGSLLSAALGWSAPVESLQFWVRGLPDPGQPEDGSELDPWGRLTRLHQDGWRVEFERYREVDGVELPQRLTANHPDLRLRLVIDDWQLVRADGR